jgi:hypothetical protein
MNSKLNSRKAQSAMEYLMTYGWAILIIAVVLGALFSLGVFSGSSFLGTSCIPSSGYLCSNPSWAHGTNNIVVTIGQATGNNWAANSFVVFVPQGTATATGTSSGIPIIAGSNTAVLSSSTFPSGLSQQVTLNAAVSSNAVGASAGGAIWVAYGSTSPPGTAFNALAGTVSYAQIAVLTIRAT